MYDPARGYGVAFEGYEDAVPEPESWLLMGMGLVGVRILPLTHISTSDILTV